MREAEEVFKKQMEKAVFFNKQYDWYTYHHADKLDKQSKLCHPGFVIIRNNIKQVLDIWN
jgi:hypothetical protein